MIKIHTCECGFFWEHGRSGQHQCDPYYKKRIAALEKQNAELLAALKGDVPLMEPVYIEKALRAGRQARVVLDGNKGPKATVHLVNISLTGWTHTAETAEAFTDGYNLALKQLRAAVLETFQPSTQEVSK